MSKNLIMKGKILKKLEKDYKEWVQCPLKEVMLEWILWAHNQIIIQSMKHILAIVMAIALMLHQALVILLLNN